MLASMEEMAEKGSTRLPDLVLTMSEAMRVRSSWGARVTSRTCPEGAPDGSYTVAPRSSERGSVVIRVEDSRDLREREMNCGGWEKKSSRVPYGSFRAVGGALNWCHGGLTTAAISWDVEPKPSGERLILPRAT